VRRCGIVFLSLILEETMNKVITLAFAVAAIASAQVASAYQPSSAATSAASASSGIA
jgi:hypothetical protein